MPYIKGTDRNQITLMPDCIDDFVVADNPVRVIDAFVEQLDIAQLGFKDQSAVEGRLGYDPRDMLKLYIMDIRIKFVPHVGYKSKQHAIWN